MQQRCPICGGTILPHSRSGAERGSCHCPRGPGRVISRMFYATATQPARYEYAVEWEGELVELHPPTLTRAVEVLEAYRAEWRKQTPPGTPHPDNPERCICDAFPVETPHTHGR